MSNFPRMHVSYYVTDINKTVAFYNELFGTEPEKVKENYAKYILESPALIISFIENPPLVQNNFGHLGFQVQDEDTFLEMHKYFKGKNMINLEEMGVSCCYAVQNKFWLNDPDNYKWEIYQFVADANFEDPHNKSTNTEVCCMPPKEEKKEIEPATVQEDTTCVPGSGCC